MMRGILKNIIGSKLSNFDYPLIVNSYGRSGSTVLVKSIIECSARSSAFLIEKSIGQSKWDLNKGKYVNGIMYKTHDYPPKEILTDNLRMIYTFSNPVNVILSLIRLQKQNEMWMKEHYQHLRALYDNFDNIINEDQLGLERHLDSWLQETRIPIAFVRYETMWSYQDSISNYLGFELKLPPYKKRNASSDGNSEVRDKLYRTYESLNHKLNYLDNFFVINNTLQ